MKNFVDAIVDYFACSDILDTGRGLSVDAFRRAVVILPFILKIWEAAPASRSLLWRVPS